MGQLTASLRLCAMRERQTRVWPVQLELDTGVVVSVTETAGADTRYIRFFDGADLAGFVVLKPGEVKVDREYRICFGDKYRTVPYPPTQKSVSAGKVVDNATGVSVDEPLLWRPERPGGATVWLGSVNADGAIGQVWVGGMLTKQTSSGSVPFKIDWNVERLDTEGTWSRVGVTAETWAVDVGCTCQRQGWVPA